MKRRHFLKSIGIIPLLIAEKSNTSGQTSSVKIGHSGISRLHLFDADKIWSKIKVGDKLTLQRESSTADPYAISINWNGYRLGYMPQNSQRSLAFLIDKGHKLSARVSQLQQSDDPWDKIQIEIYREDKAQIQLPLQYDTHGQRLAA